MKLSEFLTKQASDLRGQSVEYTAVTMLKSAGMSEDEARAEVAQKLMEKEAVSSLVANGIDYDRAVSLVKVAGVKIKDLNSFKPEPSFEEVLASQFEKAASLAADLEAKAEQAEVAMTKAAELEEQVNDLLDRKAEVRTIPEPITKLAQSGEFTNDDLEALMQLPSETLTKIASSQEQPWKMGKSAGVAENAVDPLTAFLMS